MDCLHKSCYPPTKKSLVQFNSGGERYLHLSITDDLLRMATDGFIFGRPVLQGWIDPCKVTLSLFFTPPSHTHSLRGRLFGWRPVSMWSRLLGELSLAK